jgi:hypothetical protein
MSCSFCVGCAPRTWTVSCFTCHLLNGASWNRPQNTLHSALLYTGERLNQCVIWKVLRIFLDDVEAYSAACRVVCFLGRPSYGRGSPFYVHADLMFLDFDDVPLNPLESNHSASQANWIP